MYASTQTKLWSAQKEKLKENSSVALLSPTCLSLLISIEKKSLWSSSGRISIDRKYSILGRNHFACKKMNSVDKKLVYSILGWNSDVRRL